MDGQKLETDLQKIESLGRQRLDDNYRFRSYLKGRDPKQIDAIVHRLGREVSAAIDCTTCGKCCTVYNPTVTNEDLQKLSEGLHMPVSEVIESHTCGTAIKGVPCSFLKDKKCTIYAFRPAVCAEYPHFHKPDFISRTMSAIDNYSICPIVFNVMEQLKSELDFR